MPLKVSGTHAPLGPTVDAPLLLSITIHNATVFTCINALFLIYNLLFACLRVTAMNHK